MTQYEITQGPLTLALGVVVYLNESQVKARAHAVKKRKDGSYEILEPVQFKNGEIVGFDEVPNKATLAAFFPIEKIKALQAQQIKTNKVTNKPNANAINQKQESDGKTPTDGKTLASEEKNKNEKG